MAFERFAFTKSWTDAAAFPAYEPDEAKVRADLQCLHDEAKDGINRLIDALNDASAAARLPFAPTDGMKAETVQEAIEEVFSAVTDAAAGTIINGSVTKEKLEAAFLKRIYGGRVWLSLNAPTGADNPNTDFPVGQLWLRPAMELVNLALDEWEVDGGTAAQVDGSWVFTTDGSLDYLRAVQKPVKGGVPGQKILLSVQMGEVSSHLESMCLYINGVEVELEEGGIYDTQLDAAGDLELILLAQWPFAEVDAAIEIKSLTIVNQGALEAQYPEYEPCEDWSAELETLQGSEQYALPMGVWLQTKAGQWQQIAFDTLPVSRGGTGLTAVPEGALLYGKGETLAALPPAESGVLQWSQGTPRWVAPDELARQSGYLRVTSGSYEGTGGNGDRTMTLPLEPLVLLIWSADGGDTAVIANGGRSSATYSFFDSGQVFYKAWAALKGTTVTFSNERYGTRAEKMLSQHMNEEGVSYRWMAIH